MNISTFNEWLAAFKVHDIPKMVSLLTDDARINSIVFGTYTGRDEASEYWQQLYNVFPDIKIGPVTITADENGNRIVAEIDVSGTHKGMFGSSLGTGKKFSIRGAFVYISFLKRLS